MKRTQIKRKKTSQKTIRKRLHAKAWKLMSEYVRKRDNHICVTCGKPGTQAGHFHHGKLDFCFENVHCQCAGCNKYKHGNLAKYASYIVNTYGVGKLEELELWSNEVIKYTVSDYEAIINNLEWLIKEGR